MGRDLNQVKTFLALFALSTAAAINLAAAEESAYMGAEVELVTAPNGAVINAYAPQRLAIVHPSTPQVVEPNPSLFRRYSKVYFQE